MFISLKKLIYDMIIIKFFTWLPNLLELYGIKMFDKY
jgi:hypothetical protein